MTGAHDQIVMAWVQLRHMLSSLIPDAEWHHTLHTPVGCLMDIPAALGQIMLLGLVVLPPVTTLAALIH